MKNYLEGFQFPRDERSKSKLKRQIPKTKQPGSSQVTRVRLATEPLASETTSNDLKRKNHQRINSQLTDRHSQSKYDSHNLNKTHSKSRMKTETQALNHQTIKLTANNNHKSADIDNNSLLGLVRNRLMNESKTRRQNSEHPVIKKLLELTQKAREKSTYSSKNPQDSNKGSDLKDLHHFMEIQVKTLHQQIAKQGKSTRELALCEVLREIVSYSKQITSSNEHYQSRLMIRMKELEDRNIRLLMLMNKLKMEGVDVDSFWSHTQ